MYKPNFNSNLCMRLAQYGLYGLSFCISFTGVTGFWKLSSFFDPPCIYAYITTQLDEYANLLFINRIIAYFNLARKYYRNCCRYVLISNTIKAIKYKKIFDVLVHFQEGRQKVIFKADKLYAFLLLKILLITNDPQNNKSRETSQ